jgi:lipopolysaccharide transport system ATP-binding protein
MKPIIEVKHVWKAYQKGIDRRYKSLRDTLVDIPGRLFGGEKEQFWALEDINFNVAAGESVGIIGRNGAGKSTLLKILSRITPPTQGEIILRGRVASLLEVGTGFHPELTGRENVFFNGSILGMRQQEIKRKFDEIVDFSGVENFIDTPLKHYSSGMQMRLAFSVAAHLDAEILLIDEVLAVGDAEFQKKCIGKMDDVSKGEGKSILFVSHNIYSINQFCTKCLLIDLGKILEVGNSQIITFNYLNKYIDILGQEYINNDNVGLFISNLKIIRNEQEQDINKIKLCITINNKEKGGNILLGIGINDIYGIRVLSDYININRHVKCNLEIDLTNIFAPNLYTVDVVLLKNEIETIEFLKNIASFEIKKEGTRFEFMNFDYGKLDKKLDFKYI